MITALYSISDKGSVTNVKLTTVCITIRFYSLLHVEMFNYENDWAQWTKLFWLFPALQVKV